MKSSNAAWLQLEVLEDRATPSGGFTGAVTSGTPILPSIITGLTANPFAFNSSAPGFRNTFPTSDPNNVISNQTQTLQNQLQAFQAAQTKIIDQYFSNLSSLIQSLNLSTFLII